MASSISAPVAAADGTVVVDLNATQFIILSENQRKKAALASTKDACSRLQAENQALLQQLEESTQESYQVSEHFRQELLAKNQRIAELQRQHDQLQAQSEERTAQLQAAAAARETELQGEFEALSTELMRHIEQLQAEVQGLLSFKQHKAETEDSLAALREEAAGLRDALEVQRSQLERHYAGLNAKMRKEYEQRLEELKRAQEEELEGRLDAGVKRILAANRRMAEELRLHVMETDALQSQVSLLTSERARLTRELVVKADLEAGLALRAGQQSAALKDAQAKISALEGSLQQVLSDFAAERASVVAAAGGQVQAAAGEVDALRRLLRLKGRELQQLRQLAQEVLLQRSEVEIFLLSSLHQVCMAVACERSSSGEPPASTSCTEAAAGGGSSSSSCQPQLQDGCGSVARHDPGPQHQAEVPQASAACAADAAAGDGEAAAAAVDGLDIRDLSWVDRERVLRLLLAKINGKAAEHRALQAAAAAAAAAAAGDDASAGSRGSAPQHAGRAC